MEELRQKCLEERVARADGSVRGYSALTQSPREWSVEPDKPCGGERFDPHP